MFVLSLCQNSASAPACASSSPCEMTANRQHVFLGFGPAVRILGLQSLPRFCRSLLLGRPPLFLFFAKRPVPDGLQLFSATIQMFSCSDLGLSTAHKAFKPALLCYPRYFPSQFVSSKLEHRKRSDGNAHVWYAMPSTRICGLELWLCLQICKSTPIFSPFLDVIDVIFRPNIKSLLHMVNSEWLADMNSSSPRMIFTLQTPFSQSSELERWNL